MCLKCSCSELIFFRLGTATFLTKLFNYHDSNILFLFSCLDNLVHPNGIIKMVLSLFIYRYLYIMLDMISVLMFRIN